MPEFGQPQLAPDLAGQPTVAERPRPSQLQAAQPHLQAVDGVGGNRAVLWEQTQRAVVLLVFIEDLQRLAPRRLLRIVDLAQVEHGALHDLVARDALALHHAEVAVLVAVLLSSSAAQKQGNSRMPESGPSGKRVGLHYNGFGRCVVEGVGLIGVFGIKIAENGLELRKSG